MKSWKTIRGGIAALFAFVGVGLVTPAQAVQEMPSAATAAEQRARAALAFRLAMPTSGLLTNVRVSDAQRLRLDDLSATMFRALPAASQAELNFSVVQALQSKMFANFTAKPELQDYRFAAAAVMTVQSYTVLEETQLLQYRGKRGDDALGAAELENLRVAKIAAVQAVFETLAPTDEARTHIRHAIDNWRARPHEARLHGSQTLIDVMNEVLNGSQPAVTAAANAALFAPTSMVYAAHIGGEYGLGLSPHASLGERVSDSILLKSENEMIVRGVSPQAAKILGADRDRMRRLVEIVRNAAETHGEDFANRLLNGIDAAMRSAVVNRAYLPDDLIPAAVATYVAAHASAAETGRMNQGEMLARYNNGLPVAGRSGLFIDRNARLIFGEFVGKLLAKTPTQAALVERTMNFLIENPQTAVGGADIAARAAMLDNVRFYGGKLAEARAQQEKDRAYAARKHRKFVPKALTVDLRPARRLASVRVWGPKESLYNKQTNTYDVRVSLAEQGHIGWLCRHEARDVVAPTDKDPVGEFTCAASLLGRAATEDNQRSVYRAITEKRANGLFSYEPLDKRALGADATRGAKAEALRSALERFEEWYVGTYFRGKDIIEDRVNKGQSIDSNATYSPYVDFTTVGQGRFRTHTMAMGAHEGSALVFWKVPDNLRVIVEKPGEKPRSSKTAKRADAAPFVAPAAKPARPQKVSVNGAEGGARQTSYWKFGLQQG